MSLNAISQVASKLYVSVCSAVVMFIFARVAGPEKFGDLSYLLAIAGMIAIFQDGGFKTLLFRSVTDRVEIGDWAGDTVNIALGHLICATVVSLLFIAVTSSDFQFELFVSIICLALFTAVSFISAILKGKGFFVRDAIWQAITRTLTAITILISILLFDCSVGAFLGGWGSGLCMCVLLKVARESWTTPVFRLDKDIYRAGVALVFIDLATQIYLRSDLIILRYLGSPSSELGIYSAAYKIIDGCNLIIFPIAQIWFRVFRTFWIKNKKIESLIYKCSLGMFAASIVLVFFLTYYGEWGVSLLFGASFLGAHGVLRVLALALPFMMVGAVITQAAVAMEIEKNYAKIAIIAAFSNIGLNFLLIPMCGVKGAAYSTVITECFLVVAVAVGVFHATSTYHIKVVAE